MHKESRQILELSICSSRSRSTPSISYEPSLGTIGLKAKDLGSFGFGAKDYRMERTHELIPTLVKALKDDTVAIVDCPVDYSVNMKLTKKFKELSSSVLR
jgi:hypothetical protein